MKAVSPQIHARFFWNKMPGHHHPPSKLPKSSAVSTYGLLLICFVSLFIVFQVTSHQRLRETQEQAIEAKGFTHDVETVTSSSPQATSNDQQQHRNEGTTTSSSLQEVEGNSNKSDAATAKSEVITEPLASSPTSNMCHTEEHNEYHGSVVVAGDNNKKETAAECCQHCQETPGCNAWVYCDRPEGCGAGQPRPHKECWLKKAVIPELLENVKGRGHPGISWTSGALYTDEEYVEFQKQVEEKAAKEAARRLALRSDEDLPLVFMDVAIDGVAVGRIEAVLFMKESPLAAENLRVFCTGEKGGPYHLKGAYFYRIIDRFIDQTGVNVDSIYGGQFKDDQEGLRLQHDRPYLLSIANSGPNTNTAHFSITVAPAHHLDTHYVIFGECVSGFDVIEKVNALSKGQKNNELINSQRAQIVDAGQLRRGNYRAPPASP